MPHELAAKMESEKTLLWYFRSDVWGPSFLDPGSGFSEGQGGLVFSMGLLNGKMTLRHEVASLH